MRRLICVLLAAAMALAAPAALAEMALQGSVVSSGAQAVPAPFGGTVENAQLRAGDVVHVGDPVASILTTRVYAPQDGLVGGIFAREGDGCEGIVKRYGGVMFLEPTNKYVVNASTEKAYNSAATRYVHIGETVYLSCTQDGSHQGTAIVTGVTGATGESAAGSGDSSASSGTTASATTQYTLEVTGGEFYIGETVGVFRSADYASETRIGRGSVAQASAITIEGTGSILKLHVAAGDLVERGQLLFETVDGVLDGLYAGGNVIESNVAGIVATVDAANGATVAKGANLITVYALDTLQIEAQVSVMDLGSVHVGDTAEIEFDFDPDSDARRAGKVVSISYLSAGEGNLKYYNAYIAFDADETVRMGMPAMVYLNSETGSDGSASAAAAAAAAEAAQASASPEAPDAAGTNN